MEGKATNKGNKQGKRGVNFPDEKFGTIHERNSMLILDMVSGLKQDTWEDAFKEFKETGDLKTVQSLFSDILSVLLVAEDKAFPPGFSRTDAIAYLAQIYNLIDVFFKRFSTETKSEKKKETKGN